MLTTPSETKARSGHTKSMAARSLAQTLWVSACMSSGVVAQLLHNTLR